jgi:anti-sigma factor RsiW
MSKTFRAFKYPSEACVQPHFRQYLDAYISGTLTVDLAAAFTAHIETCRSCEASVHNLKTVTRLKSWRLCAPATPSTTRRAFGR